MIWQRSCVGRWLVQNVDCLGVDRFCAGVEVTCEIVDGTARTELQVSTGRFHCGLVLGRESDCRQRLRRKPACCIEAP